MHFNFPNATERGANGSIHAEDIQFPEYRGNEHSEASKIIRVSMLQFRHMMKSRYLCKYSLHKPKGNREVWVIWVVLFV